MEHLRAEPKPMPIRAERELTTPLDDAAGRAAERIDHATTRPERIAATSRFLPVAVASFLEGALRQYLLEAALFFAVLEVVIVALGGHGGWRVFGIITGVVCLAFTGWVLWRKVRAWQQYLTVLAVFAVLIAATILAVRR